MTDQLKYFNYLKYSISQRDSSPMFTTAQSLQVRCENNLNV